MNARRIGVAAMAAAVLGAPAQATIIYLSDVSSDATDPAWLSAELDFQVESDELTLTVTNRTAEPRAYALTQVFFNASDAVTGLVLDDAPDGWVLATDQKAAGFGHFDFHLFLDKLCDHDASLAPGESVVFEFEILGAAGKDDFVSSHSEGGLEAIVAAKFVRGPGDDSAFAATLTVPAPPGLAILALAGLRRRRRDG